MKKGAEKVVVISAIYGNSDFPICPVKQSIDCEWYMFTDSKEIAALDDKITAPWQVMYFPMNLGKPRMDAKYFKMNPHRLVTPDTDVVIWIDASVNITSPGFVKTTIKTLGDKAVMVWEHAGAPRTLTQEGLVSIKHPEYNRTKIVNQINSYFEEGMPDVNCILQATCVACRLARRESVILFDNWFHENLKWTECDQISLPYVIWVYDLERHMAVMPKDVWKSICRWNGTHTKAVFKLEGEGDDTVDASNKRR